MAKCNYCGTTIGLVAPATAISATAMSAVNIPVGLQKDPGSSIQENVWKVHQGRKWSHRRAQQLPRVVRGPADAVEQSVPGVVSFVRNQKAGRRCGYCLWLGW